MISNQIISLHALKMVGYNFIFVYHTYFKLRFDIIFILGDVWHWNGAKLATQSYFSNPNTTNSEGGCIWLNSESVKNRVDTKYVKIKRIEMVIHVRFSLFLQSFQTFDGQAVVAYEQYVNLKL